MAQQQVARATQQPTKRTRRVIVIHDESIARVVADRATIVLCSPESIEAVARQPDRHHASLAHHPAHLARLRAVQRRHALRRIDRPATDNAWSRAIAMTTFIRLAHLTATRTEAMSDMSRLE
jgi:hypothetical protein